MQAYNNRRQVKRFPFSVFPSLAGRPKRYFQPLDIFFLFTTYKTDTIEQNQTVTFN